jgi:hygromycin-B 4-O-kinase
MKTTFSEEKIIKIVKNLYPNADNISNMVEGLVSQTYCFDCEHKKLVIQISKELNGYKKERYIYMNFHKDIHVRNVLKIGKLEKDVYFCITEFINAKKLQDLSHNELILYLNQVMEIFEVLANIDIAKSMGFGHFNFRGIGICGSWPEYINAVYSHYQWKSIDNDTKELISKCIKEIIKYNYILDNKRSLIHGDFGSSNVLIDKGKIYLIDWDLSLYGDSLYEVANILFWDEKCLAPLTEEIKRQYFTEEKTILKIYLYIIRIGLEEAYRIIEQNKIGYNIEWIKKRLEEIMNNFLK